MHIKDRKEYRYQIIFDVLEDYNITLSILEKNVVKSFIRGLDYVDQIQDQRPGEDFYEKALEMVLQERPLEDEMPKNVRNVLYDLGLYIHNTNQREVLRSLSKRLFKRRMLRCRTDSVENYINYSLKEADGYSAVSFLFLPKEKLTEKAKEVFLLGQRLVRILDNLIDLKEDYLNKQITLEPNWKLRMILRAEMLYLIFSLLYIYPKKLRGLIIAKRYIRRFFVPSCA